MPVDLPPGTSDASATSPDELRLATRNHGMPLEALTYDVTPVGMHYLLIHYDVPRVEAEAWRLEAWQPARCHCRRSAPPVASRHAGQAGVGAADLHAARWPVQAPMDSRFHRM